MDRYFISKSEIEQDTALNQFKEKIALSPMFDDNYNEEALAIQEAYLVYPMVDGMIKNLDYLVVMDGKETSGVIDSKYSYVDKNFLLKRLSTRDFIEKELNPKEFYILNSSDMVEAQSIFVKKLLDKTTSSICERHHLLLTLKGNVLDVAPIRNFDSLEKRYYLEKIYQFTYFENGNKKSYQSIYSTISKEFYSFDFKKSKEYEEYLKRFRKPIVAIPKHLIHFYEDISFDVYMKTKKELQYLDQTELFHKIKNNIKYQDYVKYEEYLLQLIFYFKKKSYLSQLEFPVKTLEEEIFFDYLTLKFQADSGYKLAKHIQNGLVEDNYEKMLKISADLKNSTAKKELYLYYSSPRFYNENLMKRYS